MNLFIMEEKIMGRNKDKLLKILCATSWVAGTQDRVGLHMLGTEQVSSVYKAPFSPAFQAGQMSLALPQASFPPELFSDQPI